MPVEFEGDYRRSQQPLVSGMNPMIGQNSQSGMTGWLMRKGIISTESQAKAVLLGIVIMNFTLIILIIIFFIF